MMTRASVASDLPADFPQRLSTTLAAWKRKLLDLSRRNRALNFKPTRVSTIAIVDEHPAEVFRHLYLLEATMRLKPAAPSPGPPPPQSPVADEADTDLDATAPPPLEYIPYDPIVVDERHRDEWLQTTLTPEALDHALRRIDELARTAIEEQGVNTLFLTLGMLKYREPRDAETWLRAPLLLVPIALTRKSARSGYSLTVSEEDALVNPALVEYLRATHGITLPELPDSEAIDETYDLQTFLKGAADAVVSQQGWLIQTDVNIGLFSFQKLVMFKDLEANAATVGDHRLIQQLLARTGSPVIGLPDDVRELPLDRSFTPETTYQVVDADASQMRAAAAVVRGHDIVIEGPPGTGKSQTITNLVAQALAAGKSVLFVAEKMAALDVVHRRLTDAGLGEFCLELHSTKANKRAVMKEVSAALDASLQAVSSSGAAAKRLPEVRAALATYVNAVHDPFGALGRSPFEIAGELGRVFRAPKLKLTAAIEGVTSEAFAAGERALRDLAVHGGVIGTPSVHPWRDTGKTLYTEDELETIAELGAAIAASADALAVDAAAVAAAHGVPLPETLSAVGTLREIADMFASSPGAPIEVLQSDAWNAPPHEAVTLAANVRKRQQLHQQLTAKLKADAFQTAHAADAAYVEQKSSGILSFLAFLDARYRSIKGRWTGYRQSGYSPSLLDQAIDMKQVDELSSLTRDLDAPQSGGRSLFGSHWRGSVSDTAALDTYIAFVIRYRKAAVERGLTSAAAAVVQRERPDVAALRRVTAAGDELRAKLGELSKAVAWPARYLDDVPLGVLASRTRDLAASVSKAPAWAAFESSRRRVAETIAVEALEPVMTGAVGFDQIVDAFLRAFYMKWMALAVQSRDVLARFNTVSHERTVDEFRALDEQVLRQNRSGLVALLRDRVQQALRQPDASAALPRLRRELAKQRKLSPLRRTLRECDAAIRAIKPCFMMSPLTVAQYLDGSRPTFDLVIFDEASQLPTEDAVGAIVRGRQLAVVGDPKQLPPTNFFAVANGTVTAPVGDDGTPLYEDSESVLEEFMGAAVPMSRLRWHYRSAHESLISFSNVNFYDADLHTFPSVSTDGDRAGLQFHFVDGGVYEGKGVNPIEARRIADEVVAFAREQLAREAAGEPALSLGVGTLNLRQQLAILDELEVRRREDPSIEPFFDRGGHEPFFVKNLENIQGDERDAVFLSITYGKSPDGRLRYNFGPLNRENGWRRLNVLVTRARRQMRVFSSIRDHDINLAAVATDGPRLLRAFLAYAEHRRLEGTAASVAAGAESPLEQDVRAELEHRGVVLHPQVGVSGYRVDLGVVDAELPGRYVCGIECDGVAYHAMETVRDRDRLRQSVLEKRGWIVHRVWSTDWFKDRQGQIDRLLGLIAEDRGRVDAARTAAPPATPTPAAATPEPPPVRDDAPALEEPDRARPTVPEYKMCERGGRTPGDLVDAPAARVADTIVKVVDVEGPVHEADVMTRVAALWGTKAGSRVQAAVREAAHLAEQQQRLERRGEFYWRQDGAVTVRSRAETGITADRIAPEEIREAVKLVLAGGDALPRQMLIAETRGLLGYNRTGPVVEEAVGAAIDSLVAEGALGEASAGLVLRAAMT
jgi:very-short-patch-repair endonuclease